MVGCTEDDDQQVQYGYVQFKVGQSNAPAPEKVATRSNKPEKLADAKKIKIRLFYKGQNIEQTLLLNAYNEENAEYGLRSDKLSLLAGEFRLDAYTLYDKLDRNICHIDFEEEKIPFVIVAGGMQVLHLNPEVNYEYGRVSFKLVKEWAQTRGAGSDGYYPFTDIRTVDITVQNLFTKELTTIKKIAVEHVGDFTNGSADETLYPGANAETSYALCDTIVWLRTGEYRVHHCVTYSDKNGKTMLATEYNSTDATFTIEDDVDTKDVNVPINLSETAEYIKDYIALKEIWEALDGPNWSYAGDVEAAGVNWNFNKDIDLWGEQPGV